MKKDNFSKRAFSTIIILLCCRVYFQLSAGPSTKLREPLPVNVALSLLTHHGRSMVDVSPDGQWVAHTCKSGDVLAHASSQYSMTGFPFAEGDHRMRVQLTNSKSGEIRELGGAMSSNWGAVWSPDGKRVAFYSDEGGQAGLWIWEIPTGKAHRFPGIIVRPFFGFELAQWMSDSQRILCKILPSGMTIDQANALYVEGEAKNRFPKVAPAQPSVFVLRSPGKDDKAKINGEAQNPAGNIQWLTADLAILDLRTQTVTRVAEGTQPRFYAFSPDEKYIAYTVLKGYEPNKQQPNFDLVLYDFASGKRRILAENIRLGYGIEWKWSPDSRRLAFIVSGQLGNGEVGIVTLADGGLRILKSEGVPSFKRGEGEHPPLWDLRGESVFALGNGNLWRVDVASGRGVEVASLPGREMLGIVSRPESTTIWSKDGGRTVWVVARESNGRKTGIYSLDVATGKGLAVLEEMKSYYTVFNLDACDITGEIAFVSKDQQNLNDIWLLNTGNHRACQVSHLNEDLDRYELGTARIIGWRSLDGEELHGTLLLPPGYRTGLHVPLVVWVYGNERNAARYANVFGFWGDSPVLNMHMLATRGFAVLYPDSPLRTGNPMTDLMRTVIPGVNAAIEQGYADPDRLAVMGQSYGSYCTLSLIAQTKRFKAAIITAAVIDPNLFAGYLQMYPDGTDNIGYYERGQGNMGGTPWEFRDRYFDNSPLFVFDKIDTPLLIGQGTDDGRLIPSDSIFVGLRRLGKVVEYRIYENERHVMAQKPNIRDFWQRRIEFLAEHLDLMLDEKGGIVFENNRAKSARLPSNEKLR